MDWVTGIGHIHIGTADVEKSRNSPLQVLCIFFF